MLFRLAIMLGLSLAASASVLGQELEKLRQPQGEAGYFYITEAGDPPNVESPPSGMLTLADLTQIAFQHNPSLVAAASRMNAARGRQVQAGLYPNPVIGYHATEVGNAGTAGQQGGFVSQRFITGGKLELDQAIAGQGINEAGYQFHVQERRVLSDVRVRYFDALVAQRRVSLTNDLVRIGDDLVDATEKLVQGRLATENDLLQSQIRSDQAYIRFDNSRNVVDESWRRLAAVVGLPTLQVTLLDDELESNLPDFDWASCYNMVLANNPKLDAARAKAQQASIRIARAKREPIPNIDLWVSVRHHNITESDVANIQLGIPIPILNQNQGNIWSAQSEWVAACHEIQRIELNLQDRLAVTYRQYVNARQQVVRYHDRIIPRAARSLKLVTDGYEKGQVEYLMLLTAQQTYTEVNLAYLDSLRAFQSALSLIEGQLLSDSLAGTR